MKLKLPIELVPRTSWFTNLRSLMTASQWDVVKRDCYKKAGHRCEVCGGKGHKHPVEAHEIWEYDDEAHTQTLTGTIALCPPCHQVKHMGLQMKKGVAHFERAATHFMIVNDLSIEIAETLIFNAFAQHNVRSQHDWIVDVSWVEREYPQLFSHNKLQLVRV